MKRAKYILYTLGVLLNGSEKHSASYIPKLKIIKYSEDHKSFQSMREKKKFLYLSTVYTHSINRFFSVIFI